MGPLACGLLALALHQAAARPLLFAHVMPWFEAAEGRYGWHWTMNVRSAEDVRQGRVASHFRPLLGAYDSMDPKVLEAHALWMKLAGFDGVLADWYGVRSDFDYAMIHRRTEALFDAAERAGLRIGVVYEDQSLGNAVRHGLMSAADAPAQAREVGRFLRTRWFARKGWWRIDGRPVVLVFGPQHLQSDGWAAFREGAGPVCLLTLHQRQPFADGGFDWPVPSEGLAFTRRFGERSAGWGVRVACAYPRFRDWYEEGGQKGYPDLPDDGGRTYRETLDAALALHPVAVQVATWNDWQEGTQIEPSVELGYRDLAATQAARRRIDPAFRFQAADLELPLRIFRLRQNPKDAPLADRAAEALRAGDAARCREILGQAR